MMREEIRAKLAFIRQGSETERFHTKRTIQRNDVGHHSFHVAWFVDILAESHECSSEERLHLIRAALAHDLAEHITGDMPGDFKRELGLREQFNRYERERFASVGLDCEAMLSHPEHFRLLKLADMLEGAFFCVSEASLGNARVGGIYKNFRRYIDSFAPFNECEQVIIDYIDELWAHYGVDLDHGWDKSAHTEESMQDESIVGEKPTQPPDSLTGVIRREQVEGRATPPLNLGRAARTVADYAADPPTHDILEGAPVAEQPKNDAMDDPAQPELADEMSMPANTRQYGGDHYKGTGYEHWDLVLDTGMNYFQGCATKYVTRARKHSGGLKLNLQKAIHYIDKAQEAELQGRFPAVNNAYSVTDVRNFQAANQLNELEYDVILDIIGWRWNEARVGLQRLLTGATEPEQPAKGRVAYGQADEQ